MSEARPRSPFELFLALSWLALQGFGGVLAVVQHELVERKRWLSKEEFVEEWAVAQVMPGPNVINLSLVLGARYFGWRGALMALLGLVALPLVIVIAVAYTYSQFSDSTAVQGALRGMGAVAAGLIIGSGLKLIPALKRNALGMTICAVLGFGTFVVIALLRLPLPVAVFGFGALGCVLAWKRLSS